MGPTCRDRGEIPLGNAVRVRVEPARAAEARAIIAEWESAAIPSDEEAAAEAEAAGLGLASSPAKKGPLRRVALHCTAFAGSADSTYQAYIPAHGNCPAVTAK